ncbi:MAG TPA: phospho-sugar mutase [Rhabdochlamydiaceae bacterium]|nr:phospho-sugar mutase [Rhabdochlamydiaceae bacterium]
MDPAILKRAQAWLDDPYYDEKTKAEVRELLKHPDQLTDAFYTELSFGTGGLRGIMGAGSNRINIYTIRKATQGLANYIRKKGNPSQGVAIGFDSRHHSHEFAQETAKVFAANGIKAFLMKELRPTPYVSFATRHLKAQAGVMITASHNPKEYNGYKVFWQDGGQVVPPHDTGIIAEVDAISSPAEVKLAKIDDPLIIYVDSSLDENYLRALSSLQHFPGEDHSALKICYSSLHGTGITLMPQALHRWGFSPPHLVASQVVPDGDFPTVHFPNPEYPEALKAGTEDLVKTGNDILIVTDPDADRLGTVVRHHDKPIPLSGNEQAAIAAYFICETLTMQKKMPPKGAIVTTIVTTELLKNIAKAFQVKCFEVLTGFKYIGEKIHQWEQKPGSYNFLFGAEESYGYLMGTYARDKDAMIAGCLFAEIALKMKEQGKTLIDLLHDIYHRFGIYREKQFSLTFEEGKKGLDTIHHLMEALRKNPLTSLGGQKIVTSEDFLKATPENLPRSDVLLYRLEDQSKIIIRPSGTEPKLKVYLATHTSEFESIEKGLEACNRRLDLLISALKKDLQ